MPRIALDRPFTYLLPEGSDAGTGSLVSVPFHGRTIKGWVLGPTEEAPPGRILPVRSVRSKVRFFDPAMLELLRWVSERYIAPLATVIERSHPPRVASEERAFGEGQGTGASASVRPGDGPSVADSHAPSGPPRGPSSSQLRTLLEPGAISWYRPLPDDEVESCVRTVQACLGSGRRAIVLLPVAQPLPATAKAVLDAFGDRAVAFLGADHRQRYRKWLEIVAGRFEVVVGTRPAVFAPIREPGLVWISREVHPAHREDRSPYYHVREVAAARARLHGAACVVSSLCPSVETVARMDAGRARTVRPDRALERRRAPLVETVAPEAEDRSPRLAALVKRARSAALIVSRRGYGIARVCRSCGEAAACASCGGAIVVAGGSAQCRVCGAPGRCARCSSGSFGVERGGVERVAEWAARIASVSVVSDSDERVTGSVDALPGPVPDGIVVGTAASVIDVGPRRLDLVAILDPDRALARAGLHAGEQALATWMEAAAWAGPRSGGGRVLAQTRTAGHAAIQALVRWEPLPFLRAEAARLEEAGFAPGHPSFRVTGDTVGDLEEALRGAGALTLLSTSKGGRTICLVTVRPKDLAGFRQQVLKLAADGSVTRVEAEPHL